MNDRQRIAHLLRRFGLGAGELELRQYEALGVQGAFDRLLNFEKVPDTFPISPWEFCFEENSDQVYLDPYRTLGYWCMRLQLSKRPLQEKLALFWHDHFGVSAAKIEFGPMMLAHLETLRAKGIGRFEDLVRAVARDPAMIRFLDTDASIKGAPNENFARELFELYTLGIGNYSEKDIQEAARAFTGWGIRYLVFEPGGEKIQQTARIFMETGKPMVAFCTTPDLHDDGVKTVLGEAGPLEGDDIIRIACRKPATARHLSEKLWEWFAFIGPEAKIVDDIAKVFQSTDGDIRAVLRAIGEHPAFWSEACVRKLPKNPVDFTVGITRQLGVSEFLMGIRGASKELAKPLPKPIRDVAGLLAGLMSQQGMLLLYPPDVGGWEWGERWFSSQAMSVRVRFADMLMGVGQADKGLAAAIALRIRQEKNPQSAAEVVAALLSLFDGEVPDAKKALLVEACQSHGSAEALGTPETASVMFSAVLKLLFATPEFQHG